MAGDTFCGVFVPPYMCKHEEIVKWANEYVPRFNKLSKDFQTHYYTQSPLDSIHDTVELMIIGINPKGQSGNGERILTVDQFLEGNHHWGERFNDDGTINKKEWKYNQGARFFMGYDDFRHNDSIDNDKKTVWTNLSPFESKKGSSDLRKELMEEGIRSTLELIKILRPKRIVLLGTNAFQVIEKTLDSNSGVIEYSSVFSNVKAKVGRIYNIPTICLSHPSGKWEVSNKFNSILVFIHGLAEITNKRGTVKPLKDVVDTMRNEMKLWKERVSF